MNLVFEYNDSEIRTHFSGYIPASSEVYDDQRTACQKIADRFLAASREVVYGYSNLRGRIADYFNPSFDIAQVGKSWQTESKGLYVLVHGLNGHPCIWQSQINQLRQDENKDIFVPYVPLKGNGPLEAVVNPILKVIKDYISKHPREPVCLFGVSNGGRICMYLETQLRSFAPSTPVKVSTVAAVHFGSSRMDMINYLYERTGYSLGYHPSIIKDLSFGSNKAKEILDAAHQPLPGGVERAFEFFASTEDLHVPEISSSAPKLKNISSQIKYVVVNGYDHSGIVAGVAKQQVDSCKEWMNKYSH